MVSVPLKILVEPKAAQVCTMLTGGFFVGSELS